MLARKGYGPGVARQAIGEELAADPESVVGPADVDDVEDDVAGAP
jgi:hypothetical protein